MLTISQTAVSARRATLFLSLTTAAFSGATQANQCGDISHALSVMGDNYYSLDDSEREKTEQKIPLEQSNVFSLLRDAHFKNGTGERTRCFGAGDHLRAETSRVELRDIKQYDKRYRINSELVIDAYEFSQEEKKLQRESIYFPLTDKADVLTSSDGTAIKLNTRRRQATLVGSFLRETDLSATSTDSGIQIKQAIYVNGYLAEWFSWSLNTEN